MRDTLTAGLLSYAIVLVVVLAVGAAWSGPVGLVAGVIALLATIITIGIRGEGSGGFIASLTAATLAVAAGGLAADRLNAYGAATATPVMEDLSALDPKAGQAGAMVFRSATVRPELAAARTYTYSKPKGGGTETYTLLAAPVVDSDWTRTQPVLVWAVCRSSTPKSCGGWSSGWRGALAVDSTKRDDFAEVIARAASQHRLTAAGSAIAVTLAEDPRLAAAGLLRDAWLIPTAFLSAWLAGFAVWGGLRLLRNAHGKPPA